MEQLALFAQPDVLQWLVSFALNGTHLASGQAVCTVLEALRKSMACVFFMWSVHMRAPTVQSRSSSMDILNMLVFSTPILQVGTARCGWARRKTLIFGDFCLIRHCGKLCWI